MATWLLVLIIMFSYLFVGAIIASIWEKIELELLKLRYNIQPWMLLFCPNIGWQTDWDFVVLCILFWPFFLLIVFCNGIYLLIRKIMGLYL